jgi:hypothetical protein
LWPTWRAAASSTALDDREKFSELLFVVIRPDMEPGAAIDEACVYPDGLTPDLNAAFDEISDAQI